MATAAVTVKTRKLTRDKLAAVFPNHEMVKAFEALTEDVGVTLPDAANDRDVVNVWTKNQSTAQANLVDSAHVVVNASLSNGFRLLLTAAVGGTRQLDNPSFLTAGMLLVFDFAQPAAGGPCALTFDTLYDFGPAGTPTLSTGANAIDMMFAYYDGTKLVCFFRSAGSGTVTHASGALGAGLALVGNGAGDIKALAAATDTWVLTQVAGIAAWAKASGGITRPKVQALFQLPTAL